jgi:hypothetical protein
MEGKMNENPVINAGSMITGWDAVCSGCRFSNAAKCVKEEYWRNVSYAYAVMCGKCLSREEGKMKIYISGKITGDSGYRQKFLDAENRLYSTGHFPLNPAAYISPDTDWNGAMRTAPLDFLRVSVILA